MSIRYIYHAKCVYSNTAPQDFNLIQTNPSKQWQTQPNIPTDIVIHAGIRQNNPDISQIEALWCRTKDEDDTMNSLTQLPGIGEIWNSPFPQLTN